MKNPGGPPSQEQPAKPQSQKTTESRDVENARGELANQLESFFRTKINQLLQRAAEAPDKKRFVIDQIATSRETWFKEREELLDEILRKIEAINYDTDAAFEENIVRELTNTVVASIESSGLSAEEVLRKYRIMRIEMNGDIPLDEAGVLYCSRYEDVAELHIAKGLTPDIFKKAMSVFVPIVQNDESIKTIKMKSWVVAEKLPYFKRLGFDASVITDEKELTEIRANFDEGMEENRNKPIGEAHITREDFINRYGEKSRNPDS